MKRKLQAYGFTFTKWRKPVTDRLRTMMQELKESTLNITLDDAEEFAARNDVVIGSVDDIFNALRSWLETVPARLAEIENHPVVHEIYPEPLTIRYQVSSLVFFIAIEPLIVNYRDFDTIHMSANIKCIEGEQDSYSIEMPNTYGWKVAQDNIVMRHTISSNVNLAIQSGLVMSVTLPPEAEDVIQQESHNVDGMLEQLQSDDFHQEIIAVSALGCSGDPRAFDALMGIFTDPNESPLMRGGAATALGELGDPRAYDSLLQAAFCDVESVPIPDFFGHIRNGAMKGLRNLHDPRTLDVFLTIARDEEPYSQQWVQAVFALGYYDDPRAFDYLSRAARGEFPTAMRDEQSNIQLWTDNHIQTTAVAAMGTMQHKGIIALLYELLDEIAQEKSIEEILKPDQEQYTHMECRIRLRNAVAEALGAHGDRSGLDLILKEMAATPESSWALRKPLPVIRLAELFHETWLIPFLIEELRNQDQDDGPYIRHKAAKALAVITRKDFGEDRTRWRRWWKRQQAKQAFTNDE